MKKKKGKKDQVKVVTSMSYLKRIKKNRNISQKYINE